MSYVKIGVAGPVGSGKTALIEALSRKMAKDYSIGVITNDDLYKGRRTVSGKKQCSSSRADHRCGNRRMPHTAIREDASMNLEAVDE